MTGLSAAAHATIASDLAAWETTQNDPDEGWDVPDPDPIDHITDEEDA
ncbi:hypothetical protein ACFT5B_06845 [Luteimicrobium sp. NPDC057192]